MPDKMSWKECVDQKIIIRSVPDEERAVQLANMARLRQEFWDRKIEDKFIALKIEAYYDIIKELIFSHMYKNGLNCTNHLCLIAYLREKFEDFDFETGKIDELRKLRNEISYRGFAVKRDYLERNELEFKSIIRKLNERLLL
jgi:hypothetical protein